MIAGLVRPDSGQVTLGGQNLETLPLDRRAKLGLGYLAQESTIFQGLSVVDNLRVPLEAVNLDKAEFTTRIKQTLSHFELEHIQESLGRTLSGGERRRVEMARALLLKPRVMLLDEPFAGVDPIATEGIRRFVTGLKAQGLGVLITDHNVRETLSICDRAYIIADGNILVSGTPAEIVENPIARREYLGEKFRL
jgi:lipopolysaccharide export system ATP-binding protein